MPGFVDVDEAPVNIAPGAAANKPAGAAVVGCPSVSEGGNMPSL